MERDFFLNVKKAIKTLANPRFPEPVGITAVPQIPQDYGKWDVVIASDFRGAWSGTAVFHSSKSAAGLLARSYFSIETRDSAKALSDGACEFLNQLLGMVKRNYTEDSSGFTFSLPRIVTGRNRPEDATFAAKIFELRICGESLYVDFFIRDEEVPR